MGFAEAMSSLQLMAEERIGAGMRANAAEADRQQDAASAALHRKFG